MDIEKEKKEIIELLDKASKKVADMGAYIEVDKLDPTFEVINKLEETQYHIQDAICEVRDIFLKKEVN